ncbi:hypothetical protein Mic7113_1681 [Allocoleopsis franciscana PCC 7113]|uniref:Uncharacterized protein n=1 Tax=Allocoleopsis franciscana PCC 7113 TaxID=1173027 RepID=K9WCS2_9CYAN|nr:hypothetical protein Mic7113_1681 [Allocoleopsis franciscana PCC 7113]
MLNSSGHVIQWGAMSHGRERWKKMEKGIKPIRDRVRVEFQLGQGSRFGVKLSIPVQNETCLANELTSPRLKLS